jgi:ammonium transporter, Amt family
MWGNKLANQSRGGMSRRWSLVACAALGGATPVLAQDGEKFVSNTTDIAWMLVATALVMLMTPGLALFYAGLVRRKNVVNTLMKSFMALPVVTVLWVVIGYSLVFAPGNPFIGGLDYFLLANTEPTRQMVLNGAALTIPNQLMMVYQLMFAVITPALISGAVVERMKFSAYLLFIALWSIVVYTPIAHMTWGEGGYLARLGAVDFAGGLAVHLSSGVAALILAILVGKRREVPPADARPHNLPLALLGTGLLWFGWFGFNAGSAGASGNVAVNAFIATHVSACVGSFTWVVLDWMTHGKPTAFGFLSGAVVGLVAITPGAGYVGPLAAIVIGAVAASLAATAIRLKERFGYDDTLDVFAIHGVGGAWGTLAVGLFADSRVNPVVSNGLFLGDGALLGRQFLALATVFLIALAGSLLIGMVLKATIGLRVSAREEEIGLDETAHGESGYADSPDPTVTPAPSPALEGAASEIMPRSNSLLGTLDAPASRS